MEIFNAILLLWAGIIILFLILIIRNSEKIIEIQKGIIDNQGKIFEEIIKKALEYEKNNNGKTEK